MRYHRIDGWRGYPIPQYAVAGASDCGTLPDSPAPSDKVKAELNKVARDALRANGIRYRTRYGRTTNVFCTKRWLIVHSRDFARASAAILAYLRAHDELVYTHAADLEV